MIKDYRRSFIRSIMLLTGLALLLTFAVIGVLIVRGEYNQLKNTMSIIVSPWGGIDDRFVPVNGGQQPPEGENEKPPDAPEGGGRIVSKDIATVIYDPESGGISILSDADLANALDLNSAVPVIVQQEKDFGTLKEYGVIYYKENAKENIKIAVASTSYMSAIILRNVLILVGAYIIIMAIMFAISMQMARRAAKPMEDAIEMERQFVADISHDLKTPITVVLANTSILKDSPQSSVEDQMQWVDSTEHAAKSMMGLVGEMLDLSALDRAERKYERTCVDISAAAEKCVLQMESLAFEKGVELVSQIPENVEVLADRNHVQRIVSGLIDNALKYEPSGGRVDVELSEEKKKAVLSVKNRGSYIAREDLPHIFERFYRADKARSDKKGYGLGLPIINKMAELSGAKIFAKSSEEEGTEFTVEFETP